MDTEAPAQAEPVVAVTGRADDAAASTATATVTATANTAAAATWTLLCVDDEPNIVSSLRRLFRGTGYRVLTAHGGEEALALLEREPVDLIISDMRMPGMDGAQLLERVRARWPAITRLLLTGYADVQSTVAAINRGEVYRYISKPWNDEEIVATVRDAFGVQGLQREKRRLEALTEAQNAQLTALNASLEQKVTERTAELSKANTQLKKNYLTSIKAFSNLIELRGGLMVGHARRVGDLARRTARAMNLGESAAQELFIGGLLHDIGQIGLSDSLLSRPMPRLSDDEQSVYRKHAAMGEQALMALDDMQPVAPLIRSHHERHDGKGYPDGLAGDAIPLGARILAVCDAYDDHLSGHQGNNGLDAAQSRFLIGRGRGTLYHPEVVDAFLQMLVEATPDADLPPVPKGTGGLLSGMVLAQSLVSAEGVVLLAAGQLLNADLIARIRRYEQRDGLTLVLQIKPGKRAAPP